MKVAILGLSITSSWGNGHATNYRALAKALHACGDQVTFLERDVPWYAAHRDLPAPAWCETRLYSSLDDLTGAHADAVREADLVIVGSFVPDGVAVGDWVTREAGGAIAFYDIDTPVTIDKLRAADDEYLTGELAARFDIYLSFTAGPALEILHDEFGVRRPEAFYCFVDPEAYAPVPAPARWALTYLGTWSAGRQPAVEELLFAPARKLRDRQFAVAGPMYPPEIRWPANVAHIEHVAPGEHPRFYCAGQATLNVTRPEMRALGWSPSVRLFEAAACGAAIVSDRWPGIETVFAPGSEILLADDGQAVVDYLVDLSTEDRARIGAAARRRVLGEHTAAHRVQQLHALLGGQVTR